MRNFSPCTLTKMRDEWSEARNSPRSPRQGGEAKARKSKPQFNSDERDSIIPSWQIEKSISIIFSSQSERKFVFSLLPLKCKIIGKFRLISFSPDRSLQHNPRFERQLIWWKIRYPSVLAESNSFCLMKFPSWSSAADERHLTTAVTISDAKPSFEVAREVLSEYFWIACHPFVVRLAIRWMEWSSWKENETVKIEKKCFAQCSMSQHEFSDEMIKNNFISYSNLNFSSSLDFDLAIEIAQIFNVTARQTLSNLETVFSSQLSSFPTFILISSINFLSICEDFLLIFTATPNYSLEITF